MSQKVFYRHFTTSPLSDYETWWNRMDLVTQNFMKKRTDEYTWRFLVIKLTLFIKACNWRVFVFIRLKTEYLMRFKTYVIFLLLWILLFIYHCFFGHCSFAFRAFLPIFIFAAQFSVIENIQTRSHQKQIQINGQWHI